MANNKTNNQVITVQAKRGTLKDAETLKEQLVALATPLESIKFERDDKTKVNAIINLFKNAEQIEVTENGITIKANTEEAVALYDLLHKDFESLTMEDITDPSKLLNAVQRYVISSESARGIMANQNNVLKSKNAELSGELSDAQLAFENAQLALENAQKTVEQLSGDVYVGRSFLGRAATKVFGSKEKDEDGKPVKKLKWKRATKVACVACTILLGVCVGLGATSIVFANKFNAANESYQQVSADYTGLQGSYNNLQGSYNDLQGSYDDLKGEYKDIIDYLKNNGYEVKEDDDFSDLVTTIIAGLQTQYNTLSDDYDNAKDQADKYADILDVLEENNYNTQNINITNLIQTIIDKANTNVDELDKNEIAQEVYKSVLEQLVDLGLNLSDLQDENGNFTAEKVNPALKQIVTNMIENVAEINKLDAATEAILGTINKVDENGNETEETYSLADFDSTVDAINFVKEQLADVQSALDELDEKYATLQNQYETLNSQYQTLITQDGNYYVLIQDLQGQVTSLTQVNEDQAETIKQLNATIESQKTTIASQLATINDQKKTIASQSSKLADLQSDLDDMTKNYEDAVAQAEASAAEAAAWKKTATELQTENSKLESENEQLKEELENQDSSQANGEQTTPSTPEEGGSNTPVGDTDTDENTHPGLGDQTPPEEEEGLGKS